MLQVVVDGQVRRQTNILIAGKEALKESLSQTKEVGAAKSPAEKQK